MKAIIYYKKGSPEKLVYSEIDKPVPGDNEALNGKLKNEIEKCQIQKT